MSAYLTFFQLEHAPFENEAGTPVVLGTQALRDAFARIQAGIAEGAPRICVDGKAGLGKTSLARALPRLLEDEAHTVVLFHPGQPWSALRGAIVRQLDLEGGVLSRKTLMACRRDGRRIVVVVDAAEKIERESLEHLDILLAYRTDDDEQLVHCVLLASLERARTQSDCPLLWWLDSLNTLQLEFAPIPVAGVRSYIVKHLKRAGWTGGELFDTEAARAVHRITGGVPRSVSSLCERVLEAAAERGLERIGADLVEEVSGEAVSGEATSPPRVATAPTGTPNGPPPAAPERSPDRSAPDATGDAPAGAAAAAAVPAPPTADEATAPSGAPDAASTGGSVPTRGLDAFFGPTTPAPTETGAGAPGEEPTLELPEESVVDAGDRPDVRGDDPPAFAGPAELDPEARGGSARWIAAAAVALVVAAGGLYLGFGERPGALRPSTDESTTARPAPGPPAQERLAALEAARGQAAEDRAKGGPRGEAKDGAKDAAQDGAGAKASGRRAPSTSTSPTEGTRTAASTAPSTASRATAGAGPSPDTGAPRDATGAEAADDVDAVPAAPAPLDLLHEAEGRHF